MKQRESGLPFDDIRNLVSSLPPLDEDAKAHTNAQLETLSEEGEGKLAEVCTWLSASTGRSPSVTRPLVTLFAGTHALENRLDQGTSSGDLLEEVTKISAGGEVVNRLCAQHDIGLKVFDLALQIPVEDISVEPALDEKGCAGTIAFGMEAIAGGTDLLCLASLGNQLSISNIALLNILTDVDAEGLLSLRGSENPDDREALEKAIEFATPHKDNPLEVLRRVGGRETAALCGGILSARTEHVPLIINGAGALAAAAVLHAMNPTALDHVMFGSQQTGSWLAKIQENLGRPAVFQENYSVSVINDLVLAAGMAKSACCILAG